MGGFEGSFLGDGERIDPAAMLECGVCWWVYDPSKGDPQGHVPAGTAFKDLPEHWRCPTCDTPAKQFMVVDKPESRNGEIARAEISPTHPQKQRSQLLGAYEDAAERMRDLPVYRNDLPMGVIGPAPCDAGSIALVYTPWCMNLVLLSDNSERLVEGTERDIPLPSGSYPFLRGHLPGLGAMESCSLFSPMEAFEDGAAVEAVARASFRELLREPASDAAAETPVDPSRRRFLGGQRSAKADRQLAAGTSP